MISTSRLISIASAAFDEARVAEIPAELEVLKLALHYLLRSQTASKQQSDLF
jgi:hypothetical protein